jgi:YD repeat-containing protein
MSGCLIGCCTDRVSVTDPKGNITTSSYDAARRLTQTISAATSSAPFGVKTAFTYDADGRLLQTQQSSAGTVLRTTSTTYTPTGKVATTADANGNVTTLAYDAAGRLSSDAAAGPIDAARATGSGDEFRLARRIPPVRVARIDFIPPLGAPPSYCRLPAPAPHDLLR